MDHFNPQVLDANDYYPFGSLEPGRIYEASSLGYYRYGFNGKENDNEVKGDGDQIDYGMRVYDSRSGRFYSVDPLTAKYPWYSPYEFAGDKPTRFTDRDGEEESDPTKKFTNIKPLSIRGRKGDGLAESIDFNGAFKIGFGYYGNVAQAYNFAKATDAKLFNDGPTAQVKLKPESDLYKAIFAKIKEIHHLQESDFTEDEKIDLITYDFSKGDQSDLFFVIPSKYKLAQSDEIALSIPTTGTLILLPPGDRSSWDRKFIR